MTKKPEKPTVISPQPRQEQFLSSSADIAIYGGAAGGGKTWSLLFEPLRHIENGEFGAVIFRRTLPEILNEGALWDESLTMYPDIGGWPNQNKHQFTFPSGMTVTFASLQYEKDLIAWRGAQIALIGFDQLESFTQKQFIYMLSRNRSTCGVLPYIRATCNPEPGWLADFLSWWIADDGYAEMDRVGKIRYVAREGENFIWGDTPEEIMENRPHLERIDIKSVTFIVSTIYDNQMLLSKNPSYLSNLKMQDLIDRERLLGDPVRGGNWKIKPAAGKLINRAWFQKPIHPKEVPPGGTMVRYWDLAATEAKLVKSKGKDPDYTASCLMKKVGNIYYVLDATQERISVAQTDERMKAQAIIDGPNVKQKWEREGGASGKRDSYHLGVMLDGYDTSSERPQGDKITRGKGFSAQCYHGNVILVEGAWNEWWLEHMHGQPDLPHDDVWDASTGAYRELSGTTRKKARNMRK